MLAIETRGLTKQYGAYRALDGVDLRVPAGSVFGFLGPNGAGKTTCIRVLLGLLRATTGEARVLGKSVWSDGAGVRAEIGYLPGDVRFNDFWTGRETLRFLDQMRGGRSAPEIARLADRFQLPLQKHVRSYSRGMRQKLGLIQALMHKPAVLILDEPTTALDPLVQQTLFEELRAVAADGRTILFSSHTLSEVDHLCEYVAILRGGKLIEQDRIEALRKRAVRNVELDFFDEAAATALRAPAEFHPGVRGPRSLIGSWTGSPQALLQWLATLPLEDVRISEPSLEDLFLGYYDLRPNGKPSAGNGAAA
ncbi:MAG: ABC transporter ATP-binding protein [Phycisphaerae bacterium]|nr:ABC transporter ATP-binding protein [Phycisphaerae bacterium]